MKNTQHSSLDHKTMQTPGEKFLISTLQNTILQKNKEGLKPRLLNVGAGASIVIENELTKTNPSFICDRLDITNHIIEHPQVEKNIIASVESMPMIPDTTYDVVFANYVLEHVHNLEKTTRELYRILKPGGLVVVSIPNVAAPEFKISKHTPLWFHRLIRGKPGHEISYAYKNLSELIRFFTTAGFKLESHQQSAFTYGYLYHFPIINLLGKAYDWLITKLHFKKFMGDACLIFTK